MWLSLAGSNLLKTWFFVPPPHPTPWNIKKRFLYIIKLLSHHKTRLATLKMKSRVVINLKSCLTHTWAQTNNSPQTHTHTHVHTNTHASVTLNRKSGLSLTVMMILAHYGSGVGIKVYSAYFLQIGPFKSIPLTGWNSRMNGFFLRL